MFKHNNQRGFTLIELLVVISIIGLLSSIVLGSLRNARAQARNSQRISGIVQLRTAFNLGVANTGSLPNTSGVNYCVSATCYGIFAQYANDPTTIDPFLQPAIPQKPVDPVGGRVSANGSEFGGYIYINPANYAGAGQGSPSLGTGAYITYAIEAGGSCGPGTNTSGVGAVVSCVIYLGK